MAIRTPYTKELAAILATLQLDLPIGMQQQTELAVFFYGH